MDLEELKAIWEKMDGEFLHFERVANKRNRRPDIHAFLVLGDLFPRDMDMVSAAAHDEIWLDVSPEEFAPLATEALIVELIRCGVRLDGDTESFAMFV